MSLRILAIDDSRTMRDLLKAALGSHGFDVATAQDGQQGLDIIDAVDPDVIITDINMPVMDGFGLIEGVREHPEFSSKPILCLTTESSPRLKARAREIGATGWIVKPFDAEKLVNAVKKVAA